MDIAQDANDETRQGWPGRDYLASRAKKSKRTIDRYIDALVNAKVLRIARPAAPGRRPVYEIPILFELPTTCDTDDGARSCDTDDGARSNGSYPQRAPSGGGTCDIPGPNVRHALHGAPPVTTYPSLLPVNSEPPVIPPARGRHRRTVDDETSGELEIAN